LAKLESSYKGSKEEGEKFSIYEVLPEIFALWGTNLVTDIESKKT
jgi:hypothetical protein